MEMNCYEAILATVRCSALATICAARAIGSMTDLRAIDLPDAGLRRTTALLWRQDAHRPAAARVLAETITQSYGESAVRKSAAGGGKRRRRHTVT
jgi:DNA-binding transcriptional LysR family regulator